MSESPVEEEVNASWSILILISLLFIILVTSYFLQRHKIRFIHETIISTSLGMIVGLVIRFSALGQQSDIARMVSFDHRYFFNLLLPPIILHSGYDMKIRHFFKNFGSILTFAFGGTFISTLIIGFSVYLFSLTGVIKADLLECVLFGAVLSSTDPVTILAIFNQMNVDATLYSIIFGESILNDSVAIVLFSTLGRFRGRTISFLNIVEAIFSFVGVFSGSVLIGVVLALLCALMLKHSELNETPTLESCLISLIAYSSYILSNAIQLSGIVSLLFCGIIMKHYAFENMSLQSQRTTKYMFGVLSQLSENFVFIYLGVTLFTRQNQVFYPLFIFLTLVLVILSRYAGTIPLAHLLNWIELKHQRPLKIPHHHQLMIFWAGLRGAIAFALSFDLQGPAAPAFQTTTLVVCVLTILFLGGTTPLAIDYLKIETNQEPVDEEDVERPSTPQDERSHWFLSYDTRYIRPIFSKQQAISRHPSPSREMLITRRWGRE